MRRPPPEPLLLLLLPLTVAQVAHGPLPDADAHYPKMGWVTDHAKSLAPSAEIGKELSQSCVCVGGGATRRRKY